jgi:TRAP-type mannitol/chloroaromatic compound transport system permease small subunit
MKILLRISGLIDRMSRQVGRIILWFILASALLSTGNALARKIFSIGSNVFIELQWYLYSAVFLLGAGYAFLENVHVRIDFVSSRLSPRMRSWVDIFGIIVFLGPFCVILFGMSWPLFTNALQSGEMSQSAGGLIRWPVYMLMPAGIALLFIQSLSELIKRAAFLMGRAPDPLAHKAEEKAPEATEETSTQEGR